MIKDCMKGNSQIVEIEHSNTSSEAANAYRMSNNISKDVQDLKFHVLRSEQETERSSFSEPRRFDGERLYRGRALCGNGRNGGGKYSR